MHPSLLLIFIFVLNGEKCEQKLFAYCQKNGKQNWHTLFDNFRLILFLRFRSDASVQFGLFKQREKIIAQLPYTVVYTVNKTKEEAN